MQGWTTLHGILRSGVAEQLATQLGSNAAEKYVKSTVGAAVFA